MKADEARKLSDAAKEPNTVKKAFEHIRRASRMGFNNTTILVPSNKEDFRVELTLALVKNGFTVYRDDYSDGRYCISIEWT